MCNIDSSQRFCLCRSAFHQACGDTPLLHWELYPIRQPRKRATALAVLAAVVAAAAAAAAVAAAAAAVVAVAASLTMGKMEGGEGAEGGGREEDNTKGEGEEAVEGGAV